MTGPSHSSLTVKKRAAIGSRSNPFLAKVTSGLHAHSAHAAAAMHVAAAVFLPGGLGDAGFGGDEQRAHRRGVTQRRAHDLGRVDDALIDDLDHKLIKGIPFWREQ